MFMILFSSVAKGQVSEKWGGTKDDSITCRKNLSLYQQYRDQNNYEEALGPLKKTIDHCPKFSKALFVNAEKFYERLIEQEKDSAKKQALVDSLLHYFDLRIKYHGQKPKVLGKKASALYNYRKERSLEKIRDWHRKAIESRQENSSPNNLFQYYFALYKLYKQDKIGKEKLIEEYIPLSGYVRHNIKNESKYAEYYRKVGENLDKIFTTVTECKEILPVFKKQVKQNPDAVMMKEKMLRILRYRECEDNELFPRIAKDVHEAKPSCESGYNLGMFEMGNENYDTAAKYFKEATEMCTDTVLRKKAYIAAGQNALKRNRPAKANEYARKALDINRKTPKAYIIIADAVAQSENACGDNELAQKSVYWLAVDYLQKAEQVAEKEDVKDVISKKKKGYRGQFPSKELLFNHGKHDKGGEPYEVGCWINEKTTIREQ